MDSELRNAQKTARQGWDDRYSRLAMILGDWQMVEAMKMIAPPEDRASGIDRSAVGEEAKPQVVDWSTTGIERPMPFEEEGGACALRG